MFLVVRSVAGVYASLACLVYVALAVSTHYACSLVIFSVCFPSCTENTQLQPGPDLLPDTCLPAASTLDGTLLHFASTTE